MDEILPTIEYLHGYLVNWNSIGPDAREDTRREKEARDRERERDREERQRERQERQREREQRVRTWEREREDKRREREARDRERKKGGEPTSSDETLSLSPAHPIPISPQLFSFILYPYHHRKRAHPQPLI
jgi:hypothetical protein